MTFNAAQIAAQASQVMTLLPGDVIAAGTPPGIGPLQIGDVAQMEIEGIGCLSNYLAGAEEKQLNA